ncbi:hypothetical protein ACFC09_35390 [Streptomyces sp. NPDC056161]
MSDCQGFFEQNAGIRPDEAASDTRRLPLPSGTADAAPVPGA